MDIVLVCCWWLVKGVARPPMLCVAQNRRLQAHRHCCLTWIFCVKWNMRESTRTLRINVSTRPHVEPNKYLKLTIKEVKIRGLDRKINSQFENMYLKLAIRENYRLEVFIVESTHISRI